MPDVSDDSVSVEGKVLFDVPDIGGGNEGGFAQSAFALAILALEQVAFTLFAAKNLPSARDFEAFGDSLPCFCFSSYSWHAARIIATGALLARAK